MNIKCGLSLILLGVSVVIRRHVCVTSGNFRGEDGQMRLPTSLHDVKTISYRLDRLGLSRTAATASRLATAASDRRQLVDSQQTDCVCLNAALPEAAP